MRYNFKEVHKSRILINNSSVLIDPDNKYFSTMKKELIQEADSFLILQTNLYLRSVN